MAGWADLEHELALWDAAGLTPTFWWRDDDAHAATPALEPLLALSEKYSIPAHLAVIPDLYDPSLKDRLVTCSQVYLLQHGLAHINHEPKGKGASEFGDHRPIDAQREDLAAGWTALTELNLPNLLPVLVPPWNRICDETLALLPSLGYRAVSAYSGPTSDLPVQGLVHANGHLDPIRWKYDKIFRGVETSLDLLIAHLQGRRTGAFPVHIPTCFLTHHLDMGPEFWAFADDLFGHIAQHKTARWIVVSSLYEESAADA